MVRELEGLATIAGALVLCAYAVTWSAIHQLDRIISG